MIRLLDNVHIKGHLIKKYWEETRKRNLIPPDSHTGAGTTTVTTVETPGSDRVPSPEDIDADPEITGARPPSTPLQMPQV